MTTETTTGHERLEDFLRSLGEALGGAADPSREVVDEVRADLESHVARFREAGASEEEAVDRALEEMGNPFELAHRMRREIPPFGGRTVTAIRYVAAGGVIAWGLMILWHLRAWTYGFDPAVTAIVLLLHFPVVLLLWPRIVWRRNWLFGLIPAGLALLVALLFAVAGAESSGEMVIPAIPEGDGGSPAVEVPVPAPERVVADEPSRRPAIPVAAALGAVALVLLTAMQRRKQRRGAVILLVFAAGTVEAAFQAEEFVFRQDRERVRGYLASASTGDGGSVEDGLRARGTPLRSGRVSVPGDGSDGFFLYWDRPLSSGFAIHYSSADDEVWIQD